MENIIDGKARELLKQFTGMSTKYTRDVLLSAYTMADECSTVGEVEEANHGTL